MIKVIIELELVYPYNKSIGILAEFCHLWDSTLLYGGTGRKEAKIRLPGKHFKKIFGHNPREMSYNVPSGMEKFVETLKVKEVVVK